MSPPREKRSPVAGVAPAGDCRCLCGSLLARVVEGGVELKCRRCKRTLIVPLEPTVELAVRTPRAGARDRNDPLRRTG